MDFEITDKMKAITAMINEFVDRELIPLEPEFLVKEFRDLVPVLAEKRRHCPADGSLGAQPPAGIWRDGTRSR